MVSAIFFGNKEIQYAQPTPVPTDYVYINLEDSVTTALTATESPRPVHLHFFNPDCPCSRFNIQHFVSLTRQYGDEVDFFAVIPEQAAEDYTPQELASKFHFNVPIVVDRGRALAQRCGVYATPQAVILNEDGHLYFRGNYNKTRYCTNPATNFAQLALEAKLAGKAVPDLGPLATTAYGCQIPGTTKTQTTLPIELFYGNNQYLSELRK